MNENIQCAVIKLSTDGYILWWMRFKAHNAIQQQTINVGLTSLQHRFEPKCEGKRHAGRDETTERPVNPAADYDHRHNVEQVAL